MLPKLYADCYQEFLNLLLEIQSSAKVSKQANLAELYQELQQKFRGEVMVLTGAELDDNIYYSWQSLQTEIHRTFKLLETQLMFLVTSRKSTTNEKHLATIDNYLSKLISYCNNIILL
jgi:hypothetical protein